MIVFFVVSFLGVLGSGGVVDIVVTGVGVPRALATLSTEGEAFAAGVEAGATGGEAFAAEAEG